jgi:hypothetical protein
VDVLEAAVGAQASVEESHSCVVNDVPWNVSANGVSPSQEIVRSP